MSQSQLNASQASINSARQQVNLSAKWLKQINTVPPLKDGQTATELLSFENNGTEPWPADTALVFANGDDFIVNKEIKVGKEVLPGQ